MNALREVGSWLGRWGAAFVTRRALIWGATIVGTLLAPTVVGGTLPIWATLGIFSAVGIGFALHDNSAHEQRVTDQYRNELAATLGKDPKSITKSDLHEVAYGDPQRGIKGNSVLRNDLLHNNFRTIMSITFSVLGAGLAFGGLQAVGGPEAFAGSINSLQETISRSGLAVAASWVGTGIVVGGANGLFNQLLHGVVGTPLGMNNVMVNDRIRQIERQVNTRRNVTPEQIFAVFVAANHDLRESIRQQYGAQFDDLSPTYQRQIIDLNTDSLALDILTQDINRRQVRPNELAFLSIGTQSGVPRLDTPPSDPGRMSLGERLGAISLRRSTGGMKNPSTSVGAIDNAETIRALRELPATGQPSSSFVERFATNRPQTQGSFAEREMQRRDAAVDTSRILN